MFRDGRAVCGSPLLARVDHCVARLLGAAAAACRSMQETRVAGAANTAPPRTLSFPPATARFTPLKQSFCARPLKHPAAVNALLQATAAPASIPAAIHATAHRFHRRGRKGRKRHTHFLLLPLATAFVTYTLAYTYFLLAKRFFALLYGRRLGQGRGESCAGSQRRVSAGSRSRSGQ